MNENIQVYKDRETKNQVKPEDLDMLADLWIEENFKDVNIPVSKTRQYIGRVLDGIPMGSKINNVLSKLEDHFNKSFPQLSSAKKFEIEYKKKYTKNLREHIQQALDADNLIITKKDDKVVSMAFIDKLEHVEPNDYVEGDIYELRRCITVPDERGKGIFRMVIEQAIVQLREKYGDVPFFMVTKNEIIKNICRKNNLTEVGMEEYLRIKGQLKSKKYFFGDYTAFLHIPEKTQQND